MNTITAVQKVKTPAVKRKLQPVIIDRSSLTSVESRMVANVRRFQPEDWQFIVGLTEDIAKRTANEAARNRPALRLVQGGAA
jgi:hypothetical protein